MNKAAVRILSIFGTRPEAIKLAPLIRLLQATDGIDAQVCVTAQHRQMLDQVLELFAITPQYDLNLMRDGQSPADITHAVLNGVGGVLSQSRPDRVLVQGDTTTTFAAALAAFYADIPVAHVEAGLRTGNVHAPWPEEMNRRLTTQLADLHFAPTESSRANLLRENVADERIEVTGNTVIDALLGAIATIEADPAQRDDLAARFAFIEPDRRLILTTGHRRESFDGGLERVFRALATLAQRDDVSIVFPMHLNPNVRKAADVVLRDTPHVHLIEPLEYLPFVHLMHRAELIITDSGGLQEEAPSLGKPVLVTREATERMEAVDAGTVQLVGTDGPKLIEWANRLLDDKAAYARMSKATNPYGDGKASERIVQRLLHEDHR